MQVVDNFRCLLQTLWLFVHLTSLHVTRSQSFSTLYLHTGHKDLSRNEANCLLHIQLLLRPLPCESVLIFLLHIQLSSRPRGESISWTW